MKTIVNLILISIILSCQSLYAQANQKNRVIVLTDIEADPDDTQSMVRLLFYSNEIDIKGLIATTSVWKKTSVAPGSIIKIIQAYANVQPDILKHEAGFPSAEALLILVKQGLPKYGMLGVGDGKDSQGSDWIIKVLKKMTSDLYGYLSGEASIPLLRHCIRLKILKQKEKLKN
jgi:hypothetical protein